MCRWQGAETWTLPACEQPDSKVISLKKNQPESFSAYDELADHTCLLASVVLDSVVSQAVHILGDTAQTRVFYERMRSDEILAQFEQRTLSAYNANPIFRKGMNQADPRDFYYAFMRHWVAGWLITEYPDLYDKLPVSFSNGIIQGL
jgi:hypothetical protein